MKLYIKSITFPIQYIQYFNTRLFSSGSIFLEFTSVKTCKLMSKKSTSLTVWGGAETCLVQEKSFVNNYSSSVPSLQLLKQLNIWGRHNTKYLIEDTVFMSASSLFLWRILLSYSVVYLVMDYEEILNPLSLSLIKLLKCTGPKNGPERLVYCY